MTVVGMPRSGSPISRSMWSGITTRVAHLYRAQAWVAHPRDVGGVDLIVGHRRQSRQFSSASGSAPVPSFFVLLPFC
jgi:hypothetical protein